MEWHRTGLAWCLAPAVATALSSLPSPSPPPVTCPGPYVEQGCSWPASLGLSLLPQAHCARCPTGYVTAFRESTTNRLPGPWAWPSSAFVHFQISKGPAASLAQEAGAGRCAAGRETVPSRDSCPISLKASRIRTSFPANLVCMDPYAGWPGLCPCAGSRPEAQGHLQTFAQSVLWHLRTSKFNQLFHFLPSTVPTPKTHIHVPPPGSVPDHCGPHRL